MYLHKSIPHDLRHLVKRFQLVVPNFARQPLLTVSTQMNTFIIKSFDFTFLNLTMEYNGLIFIQRHCAFFFAFGKGCLFEKTPTNQLKTPKILRFVIDLHNFAMLSPSFTHKALVKMDHHCPSIGASDKWIHEKKYENMFLCFFGLRNDTSFFQLEPENEVLPQVSKQEYLSPFSGIHVSFKNLLSTPSLFLQGFTSGRFD